MHKKMLQNAELCLCHLFMVKRLEKLRFLQPSLNTEDGKTKKEVEEDLRIIITYLMFN